LRCKTFSKSQSAFSSRFENLIFKAGKIVFQALKHLTGGCRSRRAAGCRPAVAQVSAGSE
jgi:hypothetical protein